MVETYIVEINKDMKITDFNSLLSFVSEKKKQRILRFHRFEDAQRSLLGETIARYAIVKAEGKGLSIPLNSFEIILNDSE